MQGGGASLPIPFPVPAATVIVVLGNATDSEELVLEGGAAVPRVGKFIYRARLGKAVEVYKTLTRYHMAMPAAPTTILLAKTYKSKEGELGGHQADLVELIRRDPGVLQHEEVQAQFQSFNEFIMHRDRLWAGGSDGIIQTWRKGDNTHDTMLEAVGCRWLLEQKFEDRLHDPAARIHVVVVTSACHDARTRWIFDGVFKDAVWASISYDPSATTTTELRDSRLEKEAAIWARQQKLIAHDKGFAGFINAQFDPTGAKHDGKAYRFQFNKRAACDQEMYRSEFWISFQAG